MGDWSDYFEQFPEENPGNYDKNGQFDPHGVLRKERATQQLAQRRLTEVQLANATATQPVTQVDTGISQHPRPR
ncbi:MAG: hypothetical protein R6X19_00605 [Kiritimatiellia bacterium]